MKKGFTLIELLAVIVLLGVVALIVFPTVMKSIKRAKEDLYQIQLQDIAKAAEKWATEHFDKLDTTHLNAVGVSLSDLIQVGYLQKDNVLDPRTKEQMNGCIKITYDDVTNQYRYQYTEANCEHVIESGYIYAYENKEWIQTEQNVILSAVNTIVEQYAKDDLIKTDGQTTAGFYDEGDRYVYRGTEVHNYVKLASGSEVYRILSIDKNKQTIRLMGTTAIPNAWDSENGIVFENASITTVQLENYYNNSINGILENSKKVESNAIWNVGSITSNSSYTILKSLETERTAYGKIGLPSISDFIGATTSLECQNNIFSDTCMQENYLYEQWKGKNTWTIQNNGENIWHVNANGTLDIAPSSTLHYIYPVIEMKANTYIASGDGKSVSPYIFN